jgi:DNA-binding MarR family transcriptional regulator
VAAARDVQRVAAALQASVGLLVRRLRQVKVEGGLTLSETSALSRLDRGGPATSSALAKIEQISPQSMGATLAGLESRGLIVRKPDPEDGRRVLLSVSDDGLKMLQARRSARAEQLALALAAGFTEAELDQIAAVAPLLERLAESL